ncbi:MAG: hypothetical protein JWO80_3253 [Bryobacterales bacterium]|nr:hypothetical protein [Bryobacterales bacterium]
MGAAAQQQIVEGGAELCIAMVEHGSGGDAGSRMSRRCGADRDMSGSWTHRACGQISPPVPTENGIWARLHRPLQQGTYGRSLANLGQSGLLEVREPEPRWKVRTQYSILCGRVFAL